MDRRSGTLTIYQKKKFLLEFGYDQTETMILEKNLKIHFYVFITISWFDLKNILEWHINFLKSLP